MVRRGFGSAAALCAALLVVSGCGGSEGNRAAGGSASTSPRSTPASTSAAASSPQPAPHDYRADLRHAVAARKKGSVSVAAVNLDTGAHVSAGSTGGQWMASTYKLLLTEALLAENGNVNDADAAAAIEHSDNAAGYRLFLALGGTSGTVAAAEDLGLEHTKLPSDAYDPTFTTTSAMDGVRILRNLVRPGPLTKSQRSYVLSLLKRVQADQRWGVGAAATGTFVNKNGWETVDSTNTPPEPADGGLWITNSYGIVTRHGQQLLMAVFTQHNPSFPAGIRLVEKLAKLAGATVAP